MSSCLVFRDFSLIGEKLGIVTHLLLYSLFCSTLHEYLRWLSVFLSSNEDVDEGFVVNQEGIGLRLTAMEYWKCSKAGITLPFVDKKEPDCKFVIAESLPEQGNASHSVSSFQGFPHPPNLMIFKLLHHCVLALISGRNQVDTFLEKHRAAGIQHIGLYTKDIVSTAHAMAEAGVQFFSPPLAYYTEV